MLSTSRSRTLRANRCSPLFWEKVRREEKVIKPVFAYSVDIDLELTSGRVIANPLAAPDAHAPDVSLNRNGRRRRPWRVDPVRRALWAR